MKKLLSLLLLALSISCFAADTIKIGPNHVHLILRHADGAIFNEIDGTNLKTNSGVDFIASQTSGTAATSTAQWIGLSTDSTAPAGSNTTLPSEITTSGLGRVQAVYAHIAGTTTYTLSNTYTATGTVSGLWKLGVLTGAYPGGTLVYEILLGNAITMNSGDQLQVVWTVTIS